MSKEGSKSVLFIGIERRCIHYKSLITLLPAKQIRSVHKENGICKHQIEKMAPSLMEQFMMFQLKRNRIEKKTKVSGQLFSKSKYFIRFHKLSSPRHFYLTSHILSIF